MLCIAIHLAKDVVRVGGAWLRELLNAIDPEQIKARKENDRIKAEIEAAVQAQLERNKKEKENEEVKED
jgi:hypothetical protein